MPHVRLSEKLQGGLPEKAPREAPRETPRGGPQTKGGPRGGGASLREVGASLGASSLGLLWAPPEIYTKSKHVY